CYTVFNVDVSAVVRDAFAGKFMDMQEAQALAGGEDVRTVSYSPSPAKSLMALARGGGIVEGVWLVRTVGGNRDIHKLPKDDAAKAKLVDQLDTQSLAMLLGQAISAIIGQGSSDSALDEVVDEAGESPTSADGR
ncbi:hypothetical protein LCGC14_1749400, partial [marine sediment metagenome]